MAAAEPDAVGGGACRGGAGVITAAENSLRSGRAGFGGTTGRALVSSTACARRGAGASSFPFASPAMAPDDHKFATAVTLPPRPPRAERMSYLTSRSMGFVGGNAAWTRPLPGGGAADLFGSGGAGGDFGCIRTGSGVFGLLRAAAEYERGLGACGSDDTILSGMGLARSVLIDIGATGVIVFWTLRAPQAVILMTRYPGCVLLPPTQVYPVTGAGVPGYCSV